MSLESIISTIYWARSPSAITAGLKRALIVISPDDEIALSKQSSGRNMAFLYRIITTSRDRRAAWMERFQCMGEGALCRVGYRVNLELRIDTYL